jgi:hypothetical protein
MTQSATLHLACNVVPDVPQDDRPNGIHATKNLNGRRALLQNKQQQQQQKKKKKSLK